MLCKERNSTLKMMIILLFIIIIYIALTYDSFNHNDLFVIATLLLFMMGNHLAELLKCDEHYNLKKKIMNEPAIDNNVSVEKDVKQWVEGESKAEFVNVRSIPGETRQESDITGIDARKRMKIYDIRIADNKLDNDVYKYDTVDPIVQQHLSANDTIDTKINTGSHTITPNSTDKNDDAAKLLSIKTVQLPKNNKSPTSDLLDELLDDALNLNPKISGDEKFAIRNKVQGRRDYESRKNNIKFNKNIKKQAEYFAEELEHGEKQVWWEREVEF